MLNETYVTEDSLTAKIAVQSDTECNIIIEVSIQQYYKVWNNEQTIVTDLISGDKFLITKRMCGDPHCNINGCKAGLFYQKFLNN